ncbi:HupE/UreJ family protein [Vibrio sp. E150_011]
MTSLVRYLAFLILVLLNSSVAAHTLGIDNSDLIELSTSGEYQFVVKVPGEYQPYIHTPVLPKHCQYIGDAAGEYGASEIRYHFNCDSRLTINDQLQLPWEREGAMLTVDWKDSEPVTVLSKRENGVITVDLIDYSASSGSWIEGAKRYTSIGVEHIMLGFDHLLFVLALLFVVSKGRDLIKTITAFTVAHSMTLGLATFGYLSLPTEPVEATIALSIVFLCCEVIYARRGNKGLTFRMPWVVAFSFGLLHGLGFAGALLDIGLPHSEIPLALLFFNVGVEIGQLLFVMVILVTVRSVQQLFDTLLTARISRNITTCVIYTMGILSSYWLIERTLLVFV